MLAQRLYFTLLSSTSARFFAASVPRFLAKWTMSIWSMELLPANSLVLLLALATVL